MSLTIPSDYKGSVSIAQNKNDRVKLQEYLDEKEPEYLTDLLGCELYDLFVSDLDIDNKPQTQRFIDIYNAICDDLEGVCFIAIDWYEDYLNCYCSNRQNRSKGIISMLKGFMYFEYVRDQQVVNSSVGPNKSVGVASELVNNSSTSINKNYNKSIVDYWNIQYFIKINPDIYPEFNGITKQSISVI